MSTVIMVCKYYFPLKKIKDPWRNDESESEAENV